MPVRFVLVRPRNPVNIGSAARAMVNFGFNDLAVVAPYEPVWKEAVSAVGAQDLLKRAKVVKTVEEAVADCEMVLSTTSGRLREKTIQILSSKELPSFMESRNGISGAAILFGSEKTGLPRKILERSNFLVTIPTDPACPTMNLAQSVAICAYELSRVPRPSAAQPDETDGAIGFRHRQQLIAQTVGMFKQVGYLEHLPTVQKTKFLWNLFNQWGIRKRHASLIQGLVRQVSRRVSN